MDGTTLLKSTRLSGSNDDVNHYIVRPYRFVIVVTRSVTRRTINAKIIVM